MSKRNRTDIALPPVSDKSAVSGVISKNIAEMLGMKLVVILALLHLLVTAGVMFNHLLHPAIINNAESMHAFFAYEAGSGQRLYGPLDVKVLELWYMPLAFQIIGVVGGLLGYDVRILRFVVMVFAAATFFLIGLTIYRLTRNKNLSIIGTALFAGMNVGNWYCTPGPNAIHIFFAVLGAYLLVCDNDLRWRTVLAATLALFASFWAKQTGLAFLAAGLFFFWLKDCRKAVAATIFAILLVVFSAGYYIRQPDSSFLNMILMHKNHPLIWKSFFNPFLFPEMLGYYGIMFAIVSAGIFDIGWKRENWIKPEYVLLGAGAFVGMSSIKYGSGNASAMFLVGMVVICGMNFLNKFRNENRIGLPVMAGLLLVQTAVLFLHEYSHFIITTADDQRYQKIMEIVATPGKNVHYITQPFYNVLTGTQPYPSVGRDCWRNGVYDKALYPEYLRKFYQTDPFDIIIIDIPLEDNSWPLYERLDKSYVPVMEMPAMPGSIGTTTLRNKKIIFYRKNLVGQKS